MNNPASNTDQLDPFESALLAELRREVAEHPAPAQAPRRQPRRRLKVVAAGAVATAAATVAAVGLTGGGPTASPAFAVAASPDGTVSLVIHRLDDADGLEAALAEHGIDATVEFVPTPDGQVPTSTTDGSVPPWTEDGPFAHDAPGPQNSCGIDNGPGPAMMWPSSLGGAWQTKAEELGADPDGGDYILDIPGDSVLFDRPVTFLVGSPGSFSIIYPSSSAGLWCGFAEASVQVVDSDGQTSGKQTSGKQGSGKQGSGKQGSGKHHAKHVDR